MLTLHNSATRSRQVFTPADPANIRLYVCGPTVYDLPHIGNIRSNTIYDVLARVLRVLYPRVTYVRNITDVDDKINARAQQAGIAIGDLTRRTTEDFHADMAKIGNLPPDIEPRATEHIAEMIAMIEALITGGHAYAADGHVLFRVGSYAEYGKLSGRSPEDLLAGARVEVAAYKQDPGDFVLWKPSAADLPGWPSPWGRGRPGWHIECSAMAHKYLGETFDIHGGGSDLIFPHHENERAQSNCAHPHGHFANVWLHNGMLQVNGQKMSKSLGNFFTLRDVLKAAPAEAIRVLLLRTHYRAALDFTDIGLVETKGDLDRFYRAIEKSGATEAAAAVPADVLAALCDDVNTPLAFARMFGLADRAMAGDAVAGADLLAAGQVMGLLKKSPTQWFRGDDAGGEGAEIDALIAQRLAARQSRDFALSDKIRNDLAAQGILLEDGPGGTTWRKA